MSRQLCNTNPYVDYKIACGCPECVREMRELIKHMWIHDGYRANGYLQMIGRQKALYCAVTGTDHESNMKHCLSK